MRNRLSRGSESDGGWPIAAVILLLAGAASALIWGVGWNMWIPLAMGTYLVADFLIERFSAGHARAPDVEIKRLPSEGPTNIEPGEFRQFRWRDERDCFGTVIQLDECLVYLDLAEDHLLEERREVARALAARGHEVATSFLKFKKDESKRQPKWSAEIIGLQPSLIGFYDKSDASVGEVYFTLNSGRDKWYCGFKDGGFCGLRRET